MLVLRDPAYPKFTKSLRSAESHEERRIHWINDTVAGFIPLEDAEAAETKEVLVAGGGFEPPTFGL